MSLFDSKEHNESSFKQNKTHFNYNIKTQNNQHLTGNILEENKQKNHTLKKSYVQELNCYLGNFWINSRNDIRIIKQLFPK